ncbi:MAG: tyrosine-type recombinase/integrase [Pyrinomonadaceae bacterium]
MAVENRGTAKNPRWRYAFTIRGVRYRAAVPEARTKYEAEQAEVEAKKAVFEGRFGRPTGEHDFAKFVGDPDAETDEFAEDTYLAWAKINKRSWVHDKFRAKVLVNFFRGKTFAQISPLLVEKYKRERRESITKRGGTRAPATVNRELALLSRIFTMAMRHKLAAVNPCTEVTRLSTDNRRVRYLLDEEEQRLLPHLTGPRAHMRPAVLVAIGTGMRRGDQLNLRWDRVDFQRDVIWVPNAKTGQSYTVPMSAQVREIMLELRRKARGSIYVFANPETGKPYTELRRPFDTACRDAGIEGLRWHDLRHTFGTRLAEAGHSEATIAELMGHSNPKTTRRYTHGTERAKRMAVEATTRQWAEGGEQRAEFKLVAR